MSSSPLGKHAESSTITKLTLGDPMKFFALLLLVSSTLTFANDSRCLDRLGDMLSEQSRLVETKANDGKPLTITLTGFSSSNARISATGVKDGKTFGMVSGQFAVIDCTLGSAGVSFKMRSGMKTVTIKETSTGAFKASALFWKSEFRLN